MAQIVERHLSDLRLLGQSPGTIEARRRAIFRMVALIDVPFMEVTHEDLATWRASLRVTENTVVHYASHARRFFDWAVAHSYCEVNPASGLLVPFLTRGLPRPIGEDALAAAVAAAVPPVRLYLDLAAWAGLRAKEIALLRRECVLDTVVPPVLLIARDATKGHRERVVPMSGYLAAELRPHLPRAGWVFARADGRPGPNSPARISQTANAFLHSLGIAETLHQLRHRFGTMTYRATRDLRVVQELMGHADPATTAGYAAYSQDGAIEAVEALPVPGRREHERRIVVLRETEKRL